MSGATKRRNGPCDCQFRGGKRRRLVFVRALNVALVVAGVLVNVFTSRDTTLANSPAAQWPPQNGAIVYGLHVALPTT